MSAWSQECSLAQPVANGKALFKIEHVRGHKGDIALLAYFRP
jgi:hypothetical protein